MIVTLFNNLRGYRRFFIDADDVARAADRLLRAGIGARFFRDGSFCIPLSKCRAARLALGDAVPYRMSEPMGLPGFFIKNRRKYGVMAAILFCAVTIAIAQNTVFDVRVEGNDAVPTVRILERLEAGGLFVGARWSELDRAHIEGAVLTAGEELSWLHVNRRGLVAYVTVAEKEWHKTEQGERYANLVATEDALVQGIRVRRGCASVAVGESVKAGDLLISGVLPGAGGVCTASGEVIGRVTQTIRVLVPRRERQIVHTQGALCGLRLDIFGFSLNILKNYGNPQGECAIIEDEKEFMLPNGARLPISLCRTYAVDERGRELVYDDAALVRVAAARLHADVRVYLAEGDLVSIRTVGAFTDEGYVMTAEVVAHRPIGRLQYLDVQQ